MEMSKGYEHYALAVYITTTIYLISSNIFPLRFKRHRLVGKFINLIPLGLLVSSFWFWYNVVQGKKIFKYLLYLKSAFLMVFFFNIIHISCIYRFTQAYLNSADRQHSSICYMGVRRKMVHSDESFANRVFIWSVGLSSVWNILKSSGRLETPNMQLPLLRNNTTKNH